MKNQELKTKIYNLKICACEDLKNFWDKKEHTPEEIEIVAPEECSVADFIFMYNGMAFHRFHNRKTFVTLERIIRT